MAIDSNTKRIPSCLETHLFAGLASQKHLPHGIEINLVVVLVCQKWTPQHTGNHLLMALASQQRIPHGTEANLLVVQAF